VYVPGRFFATTPDKVESDRRLPVVLYLHGCSGITWGNDIAWGRFVKNLGFVAILPDSMARPGRKANCDPRLKTTGSFPPAGQMRQEEIAYALERLNAASWADTRNIFLMGHSEGGAAAARATADAFRGIIISGWTCTNARYPAYDGIFAPLEIPILAIAWDRDEWYAGRPAEGVCANKFGVRTNARQVLLKGSDHATYGAREARDAVERFLRENLVH